MTIKYTTNRVINKLAERKANTGLLKDRIMQLDNQPTAISLSSLKIGLKVKHMIRNHIYGSSKLSTKSKGFAPTFFVGEIVDIFPTTLRLKLEKDGKSVYKVVKTCTCYELE